MSMAKRLTDGWRDVTYVRWGPIDDGGVAEWSKAAVLKTVVPQGTVGSNPTSSAICRGSSCNLLLDNNICASYRLAH